MINTKQILNTKARTVNGLDEYFPAYNGRVENEGYDYCLILHKHQKGKPHIFMYKNEKDALWLRPAIARVLLTDGVKTINDIQIIDGDLTNDDKNFLVHWFNSEENGTHMYKFVRSLWNIWNKEEI